MLGENPSPIVVKSLVEPESLSLEELRVMDAYFVMAVNEIRREGVLRRLDLEVDEEASFENLVPFYFGNEFGQQWWRQFMSEGEELNEVNRLLDDLVRSADPDMTLTFFTDLQDRLAQRTED